MNAIANSIAKTSSNAVVDMGASTFPSSGQYLTFVLGGEVFSLEILNIKEIIQFGDLTTVPMMPNFVRGVINLRGRVVPVVDLAARFGRGSTNVSRRTSIIIIEMEQSDQSENQSIGIMVDAVNEVIDIAAVDIEPPPSFGAKIRPDFISGMAKKDGRFIIVLNLNQVLSIDEMIAIAQSSRYSSSTEAEKENES